MMFSGAARRKAGVSGRGEERVVLETFHHSFALPSTEVQMTFQSNGF